MKRLFAGTVPKDPQAQECNEDKFCIADDGSRMALCDGASESFDSRLWAEILAKRFITNQEINPEWLLEAQRDYAVAHDFASMSWSKQAAYERGSFSTFIGVEDAPFHGAVEILAIGDSIAILCDGDRYVRSWPFSDPEQFRERPTLLCTLPEHSGFVGESGFWTAHGTTFQLNGLVKPILLCMTDALGEWALREALSGGNGLSRLASMKSEEELAVLVIEERRSKKMRIDDSTLIVLAFDSTGRGESDISQP
jgi:hypothetical protein